MSKSLKWIWLAQKCGQGSPEILTLVEKLGSIEAIYNADFEAYTAAGVSERLAEDLCDKDLHPSSRIVSFCQSANVGILCYDDPGYPASLRALKNPPAVLYWAGRLPDFNRRLCIAVVGTRKMSEYGMRAAYKISYEIASTGIVVVSGMALGIDGIASCAAIAAGGETVAVLGCGIDYVYPKEHLRLCEMIRNNGAVITEYPPGTEPRGMNFPVRNRIISGLCQGTVVVDADKSSGAMITAKNAILQGRDVYAVPGNIDAENTSGTNSLIRDGAQAVLCGADIVRNYSFMYRDVVNPAALMTAEKRSEFDARIVRDMRVCMRAKSKISEDEMRDDGRHIGLNPPRRSSAERGKQEIQKEALKIEKQAEAVEKTPSADVGAPKARSGDDSNKALETLSEKQRKIFDEMPLDRAVTVDYLTKTGFALGEVISALTVLEIKGLISSLPGALYVRK